MKEGMITVISETDAMIGITVPDLRFNKTWNKRGVKLIIDREQLEEAYYYAPGAEYLFKSGLLVTDDKQFLEDVGLIEADNKTEIVAPLTEQQMKDILGKYSILEMKKRVETLSTAQLADLGEYAILHSDLLKMDRIDYLSQKTGKKLSKAIENK